MAILNKDRRIAVAIISAEIAYFLSCVHFDVDPARFAIDMVAFALFGAIALSLVMFFIAFLATSSRPRR